LLKTHRQLLLTGCLLFALLVLLFAIVSQLPAPATGQPPTGVQVVNYTTFIAQVRAGNIRSVTIQDNQLLGVLAHPLPGNTPSKSTQNQPFVFSPSDISVPSINPAYLLDTPYPAHINRSLIPLLLSKGVTIQMLPAEQPSPLFLIFWKLAPFLVVLIFLYALLSSSGKGGISSASLNQQFNNMTKSRPRRFEGQEKTAAVANEQRPPAPKASRPDVTFADVAGIDEARAELEEVVQFLRCPQQFDRLGAHIPRGVMLVGAPGTGKTLLAKAVAGEANVPFFNMSASEFVEMFVGVGASRVRDLFQQARQAAPCVVFIDEIDAVGRKRSAGLLDQGEREQTLNQLLVELDGFEERSTSVVMAATNRVDMLDPALLRPGRFDRRIFVSLPDRAGREAILRVHTRHTPLHRDVQLEELARMTTGMSGADLANLVNEAALDAARRNLDSVSRACFEKALVRVQLGAQRALVMSEAERRIIAFHESGHALVAYHLPGAGIVSYITILPHGQHLGATQFVQEEDHYNYSREVLIARIAVRLGGRVAEELTFGAQGITTGAEDDLRAVTKLAWHMVTHWGMSKQLGPVFADYSNGRAGDSPSPALPIAGMRYMNSREMATLIDSEVQAIVREAHATAHALLSAHYDRLALLARVLLERERLNRAEFEAVLQGETLHPQAA
jgi:cell division protease FtsH